MLLGLKIKERFAFAAYVPRQLKIFFKTVQVLTNALSVNPVNTRVGFSVGSCIGSPLSKHISGICLEH